MEATPDKDDSRSLHIVIQQPFTRRSKSGFNPLPVLTAKFVFDDYIRCMSARQRLQKRCDALRRRKMSNIGTLLELPALASPSNYYTLTSLDASNTVWSPSSRGYSSSRHQNGDSSPVSSSSSSSNTLSSTPTITSQATQQKPRLLSPKMEQILQKQIRQDGTDSVKTPIRQSVRPRVTQSTPVMSTSSSNNRTPMGQGSEAVKLASLLQATPPFGPMEITGHAASVRDQANTMEVGEELVEESVALADSSSSFVLINDSAAVQQHIAGTPPAETLKQASKETLIPTRKSELIIESNQNKSTNSYFNQQLENSIYMNFSLDRQNSSPAPTTDPKISEVSDNRIKCESAPGSPRGRRHRRRPSQENDVGRLSKSLPAMALTSSVEERKHRAQRARAKAKTAAKQRGGGGGSKKSSRR